ncbi:MAG: hypothetical protein RL732_1429 [Bacteroidota bacterium]
MIIKKDILLLPLSLILLIFFEPATAQMPGLDTSKYGVPVVRSKTYYWATVKADQDKELVELTQQIPGIVIDLRYASADNFTHQPLYPTGTDKTYLRKPAAEALAKVQQALKEKGLGLKIFDAYRPYHVTEQFWELIGDERYVAHPSKGSGHNRGLALDLTLINLKTGKELDMGTGFDNFTDSAHHVFTALPDLVMKNRVFFKEIMIQHGFQLFETEWWHYSWPNNKGYEVMDLDFGALKKRNNK